MAEEDKAWQEYRKLSLNDVVRYNMNIDVLVISSKGGSGLPIREMPLVVLLLLALMQSQP